MSSNKLNLDAYYYSFEATGVDAVDTILSAVANAGAGYHNTEDWREPAYDGSSPLSEMQAAAEKSAEAFRALLAEVDRLRTAEGDAMTYKAGMENVAQQRDQLKAEVEESASVIDQLAKILAGVAVALKGEELPLHRHGYHDLVEGVTVLKLENDLRKAENEALRNLAVELRGAAKCYNLHHCKAEQHAISEPCRVLARIDAAMSK